MKLYRCDICGNLVLKAYDAKPPLSCCGQKMSAPQAGVTDAAQEKHVPALKLDGNVLTVHIGDVTHPMTPEHFIQTIAVEQGETIQYQTLTPDQSPTAVFFIDPSRPFAAYEYCNLHGLWKIEQA